MNSMPPMKLPKNAGQKATKGTLKRLLKSLFKQFAPQLIIVAICLVITTISNLSASVISRFVTDALERSIKTGSDFWAEVTPFLIIMISVYVIAIFTSFTYNLLMAIVTQKFLNYIRKKCFDHMETLPIKYFDTHPHGDIMSIYTNDIDTIRQLVSQSIPILLQTILTVIALLFIMGSFSIWLLLIVLCGTVFMFLNTRIVGGRSAKFFVLQQRSMGIVEGAIEENMTGLKVIKVFNHEDRSLEDFERKNNELCKNSRIANINSNILGPITANIGNILYVIIAIIGSVFMLYAGESNLTFTGFGSLSYGVIVSFLMMSRMFTNNINNFAQQINFVVMGIAGASRVFGLIDEPSEVDNGYVTLVNIKYNEDGSFVETSERTHDYAWRHPHGDGTLTYSELKGHIVLDQVDFGYVPERLVLQDVSIYAKPGQQIALVGATGAGKTTITNLINRFYDIADGKVRYDGININKIKKPDLRRSLGIVLQDTSLFSGTIMENIRYGRLDATDEEVMNAAKIANAYEFIMRLPEGFNTMLTSDGSNLSQGQRQLLSIARAACADAPVMILDEATSSIDTRTEKLVQDGMDQLMEGRTVFVIAHRLSTIQNSNAIMVLEKGKIIERGDHDDLIALKGKYYQLYTGLFELE